MQEKAHQESQIWEYSTWEKTSRAQRPEVRTADTAGIGPPSTPTTGEKSCLG